MTAVLAGTPRLVHLVPLPKRTSVYTGTVKISPSLARWVTFWAFVDLTDDALAALASATDRILGYGTPLGIFCASAGEARRWSERGLTLLAISTDLGMLRGAAVSALGQLRAPG